MASGEDGGVGGILAHRFSNSRILPSAIRISKVSFLVRSLSFIWPLFQLYLSATAWKCNGGVLKAAVGFYRLPFFFPLLFCLRCNALLFLIHFATIIHSPECPPFTQGCCIHAERCHYGALKRLKSQFLQMPDVCTETATLIGSKLNHSTPH